MFSSLFFENAHFAINLFAFLSFVAAFWLHLDAWIAKKRTHSFIGLIGWLSLAVAFLVSSSRIESTVLTDQFFSDATFSYIILITKIIGYACVSVFAFREPIQLHPKLHKKPPIVAAAVPAPAPKPTVTTTTPAPAPKQAAAAQPAPKTDTPKRPGLFGRIFSRGKKKKEPASPPIMPKPEASKPAATSSRSKEIHDQHNTGPVVAAFGFAFKMTTYAFAVPILSLITSLAYLRRATAGIERHVKPLFYTFLLFSIYESLALASLWQQSADPSIFTLTAAYGPLWIAELVVLLLASALLLKWVSKYLLLRLKTQLFMIFISMALGAFVVTATAFSALLLQNMESAALDRLQTDARIFRLMLEQQQEGIISDAQVLAQDTRLHTLIELEAAAALSAADEVTDEDGEVAASTSTDTAEPVSIDEAEQSIASLARNILLGKQIDTLIITDVEGKVLARGEDPEQRGDSLSDNPFVSSARSGNLAAGFVKQDGAVAPVIAIRAAVPIQNSGQVVGVVLAGRVLDNPFLDGIKRASNLDTVLYTGNVLSASTLEDTDDSTRWIGTVETDSAITNAVLERKEEIQTSVNLLGQPYLASYTPLLTKDQEVIGMLLIGVPQIYILRTAAESIQITFLISAALMIISIPLALFFAYRISKQVE